MSCHLSVERHGCPSSSRQTILCKSELWTTFLGVADKAKQQMQDCKRERTPKGCAEGCHGEAGHKFARKPQHYGVDDQEEDSERKDAQRQRDDLEEQAQRRVEEADDDDRDQGGDDAVDVEAHYEVGDDQQGYGIQNPVQK